MTKITNFEDLEAWQLARQLTRRVYAVSGKGAFSKDFALRDQIRRAAISVMSNIAEGFESRTTRMFIEYLGRAKASAGEVRSQLYIALDAGYLDQTEFDDLKALASRVSRQISGFMQYLDNTGERFQVRENEPPDGYEYP